MNPLASFLSFCLFSLTLFPSITTATYLPTSPSVSTTTTTTTLGVTYTSPPPPSPSSTPSLPADHVLSALSSLNIHSLRLPNPDPNLIRSFAFTNTSLFLSIPNSLLPPLAANRSLAARWLYGHVLPFYPRSKISLISVGEDAVSQLSPFLLPAIRNVYLALRDLGIKKISVSTTFSFVNVITTPFPPSSGTFQEPLGELLIKPLLQFLEATNSSFLVNLYPYNLYRINSEIPLGFALFQEHPFNFRDDLITGVRYWNLFDMMVDAVVSALAVAGHENLPVIVAETGWPSTGGDQTEVDAKLEYAEMYIRGLVGHLRSGVGTPLRKEGVSHAYIFELIDKDNVKQGTRNWGILYVNMSKKYHVEFSGCGGIRVGRVLSMRLLLVWWLLVGFFLV
ncbi:PREDICTED: glucan endo-1,3-beta-glucosidase 2 [Populus euphratica]|uniref:glucan endo-1,3-beta-D-glucosidase n=1 Tax=Populus euphratica TaxID=75702 RepID=A0AAJ6UVH3_POPEU|nr:PREDICTED: glucan endo-1,3-beta-glucosidase 2 [Populus euphratica]